MKQSVEAGELTRLAEIFARAWITNRRIETVPPVVLTDRNDAYRVQDMMSDRIAEPVAGWKAGATSEGMRARDGHDGIVPGRVFSSGLFEGTDHVLAASALAGAHLEPEFAFRFRHPAAPDQAPWTASRLATMVSAHIAVEIIGSRMSAALPDCCRTTAMTIADNGNGIALVIGPQIPDDVDYDPLTHPVEMRCDGGPPAANSPADIRAQPLDALVDTVNLLAARGIGIQTGQYITTGSATATLPVLPDSTVTADFGRLGSIRLRFSS